MYLLRDGVGKLFTLSLWSVAFVKGFFLCNTKTATCGLLGVELVKVAVFLFEARSIEAVREYRSPTDDETPCFHFLSIAREHFGFDFIP